MTRANVAKSVSININNNTGQDDDDESSTMKKASSHLVISRRKRRVRIMMAATTTLVLVVSKMTRVKGESSTIIISRKATTSSSPSDNMVPFEELIGFSSATTTSSRKSSDTSNNVVPFEELGGGVFDRRNPSSTLSSTSTLSSLPSQRRTTTVVSKSYEERLSRSREEQSRFSPVDSRWGDVISSSDTAQRDDDDDDENSPFPFATAQQNRMDSNEAWSTGATKDQDDGFINLRGKFRRIRNFLGPNNNNQGIVRDSDGLLPLAYRYYGRKFARPPSAGSIPIILFGPNADHWKVTGQQLQQKGFSVIACERVIEEGRYRELSAEENVRLIVKLLDALRWQNALLVACDQESVSAIQVAMRLAPDRIAGLVLCGNLVDATIFATSRLERSPGLFGLDAFLQQLPCPFNIVWDGDFSEAEAVSSMTSDSSIVPEVEASLLQNRSLLLGGGAAPHRRRPEQLAWIIVRFVELKLARQKVSRSPPPPPRPQGQETEEKKKKLPFGLSELFSQESMVVVGRILAVAIAYGTVIKVGLYQYDCFRSGIFDFQTRLHEILYTPEKLASAVVAFFRWVPRAVVNLFGSKQSAETDDDDESPLQAQVAEVETNNDGEEEEEEEESNNLIQSGADSFEDSPSITPNATDTDEDGHNEDDETKEKDKTDDPMDEEHPNYAPLFFLDHVVV